MLQVVGFEPNFDAFYGGNHFLWPAFPLAKGRARMGLTAPSGRADRLMSARQEERFCPPPPPRFALSVGCAVLACLAFIARMAAFTHVEFLNIDERSCLQPTADRGPSLRVVVDHLIQL